MLEQIGDTAGKVWNVLGQEKRLALGNLPKFVNGNKEVAYLALGWLAREGKVEFKDNGTGGEKLISLTEAEKDAYKKSNDK